MKDFIQENLHLLIVSLVGSTGFAGWFFEKRKRKIQNEEIGKDVDTKAIANTIKVVDMYRESLDDLGSRYQTKFTEVTQLYEQRIKLLQDEIRVHKRMITNLKKENTDLRKRIKELEK